MRMGASMDPRQPEFWGCRGGALPAPSSASGESAETSNQPGPAGMNSGLVDLDRFDAERFNRLFVDPQKNYQAICHGFFEIAEMCSARLRCQEVVREDCASDAVLFAIERIGLAFRARDPHRYFRRLIFRRMIRSLLRYQSQQMQSIDPARIAA